MSFDAYTTAGQGQNLFQQLCIQAARDPVNGVDFSDPGGGPYQIGRRWFNRVNDNYWRYQGQGIWILDSGNPGPLLEIGVPNPPGTKISPDATGLINFTSTGGTVTITGTAGGLGNQDINFDVAGGAAFTKMQIQDPIAPGVNPVTPDGTGLVTINGFAVANHGVPIETASRGLNAYNIEAQIATAVTPTPINTHNVGMACYNTNQFTFDATSGMVSLKGGTVNPALTSLGVDFGPDNPVVPDATGKINLFGASVAAGTNPVRTDGTGVNTAFVEVQRAQAIAGADTTKVGLANFNSAQFTVANGFVSTIASPTNMEGAYNIGISYSAGIFTVLSANGTAFSASNPGFITINSATTPGTLITITITANQTFQDNAGTGTINSNVFGTGADTINLDIPFYIYAVLNTAENAIAFAVGRQAARTLSPVAGSIGVNGTNNANSQFSFFLLGAPVIANYATQPSLMIGSFRMKKTGASTWVVTTLASTDGIGRYQMGVDFNLPTGVLSASSGSYWLPQGGTAPIFTTQTYFYRINHTTGFITINFQGVTVSNSPAGATQSAICIPMACDPNMTNGVAPGEYDLTGGANKGIVIGSFNPTLLQFVNLDLGGSGNLSNGQFTGIAIFRFQGIYAPATS